MKKVNVILKVAGLSAPQLAVYGQTIARALKDNSNFTNLYPKLATLEDGIAALNTAIGNNRPGDKITTAALHSAVTDLKRILKALVAHVEFESDNDQNTALSSGFQLRQLTQRTAQGFEINYGEHSGSVELKCPREANAGYIWEYSPEPASDKSWITAGNSVKANFQITGLTPGVKYWFRVSTVTKNGQHPPCDPIMVMII